MQDNATQTYLGAKRQTKHIKTKKIQTLERIDKAVWCLPLIVMLWLFRNSLANLATVFDEGVGAGLFTLVNLVLIMGVFYLPLMLIWRAVSHTLKQNAIAQTTFPVLEDFEYYRDELTGVSPATISMCVDFEIERDKDLAAQLLRFSMQGLIDTDGTQITVLAPLDTPNLTESERFLLDKLRQGRLQAIDVSDWADLAWNEVMAGPYLTKKEPKKAKAGGPAGCLGCLPFFLFVGLFVLLQNSAPMKAFNSIPEDVTNKQLMDLLLANPDMMLGVSMILVFGIGVFCSMALPIAVVLWGSIRGAAQRKNRYKRTEAGEILTEEIYGLKNFIHDFSDLEHAQKETLVLWDDFLIYAVLLEENEAIVAEITAMRNLTVVTPTDIY